MGSARGWKANRGPPRGPDPGAGAAERLGRKAAAPRRGRRRDRAATAPRPRDAAASTHADGPRVQPSPNGASRRPDPEGRGGRCPTGRRERVGAHHVYFPVNV